MSSIHLSHLCSAGLTVLALLFSFAPAADKPNVLFIAVDDLNDWVGPLEGHPQVKTPNMDRLAARGVTFTNAHCQSPLCNSSRTSLMTGLRPDTTGIYGLAPWFRDLDAFEDVVTLPQFLEGQGYTTYSTGKIYHGGYGRQKNDREFQILGPPAGVGAWPKAKLVNTPSPHKLVDWGVFPHKDEDKGDFAVASWAAQQLENGPREPFFLSAGFFLPHVPCYATRKWFDLYPEETVALPPILRGDRDDTPRFSWYLHWTLPEPRLDFLEDANEWKNLVRSYLACVSFVDSQIGRLLNALEKSGFADNTIVILWSDHGWHLGEKRITGKNTLWDRSTRVPLIFAGPGIVRGSRCGKPVELLDIYPTLVDLCGDAANSESLLQNQKTPTPNPSPEDGGGELDATPNPSPEDGGGELDAGRHPSRDWDDGGVEIISTLEGHSLVPQLKDPNAPRPWPAITTHNHDNHGIRTERWRYIRYADGTEELYDMESDPNEWHNLADDKKFKTIKNDLRRSIPPSSAKPAPGSRHRILTYDDGTAIWEGAVIGKDERIPEID